MIENRNTIHDSRFTNKRGFTVVELLVYSAIMGFVLVFVISGMVSLNKASISARLARDLNTSGATALERIIREVRDASSVLVASSTLSSSPGKLVLNNTNASTTGGIISFYMSAGKLVIDNGASVNALTSRNVSISQLYFYYGTSTHSQSVRVQLQVSATGTQARMYYDSAVLRESYVQ